MASILCVDDNRHVQQSIKDLLEQDGHIVELVASVEEAFAALLLQNFDLVICDGSIKRKGDGADYALTLRQRGQRVIIFSGDEKNRRQGVPFVHKLGSSTLTEVVRKLLYK